MLADTPWMFPFWFAWVILSLIAPLLLIAIVVLSCLRTTRHIGLKILFFGLLGAEVACIADVALARLAREPLSQSIAIGWMFAAAGDFSLFPILQGSLPALHCVQPL